LVEHLKVRVYLLGGGVSMAALTVEPLTDLMVEHLKVMAALTVEPACASLSVEPPVGSLHSEAQDPPDLITMGSILMKAGTTSPSYSITTISSA